MSLGRQHSVGVRVDGVVFGLSPYGGLIRYWQELLSGLARIGVPVQVEPPARLRATLPQLPGAKDVDAKRWVFHSTYFTAAPRHVDANVVTVHDLILEERPQEVDPTGTWRRIKAACVRRADAIIVPSSTTARKLGRHYPHYGGPVHVVPQGLSRAILAAPSPALRAAAEALVSAAGSTRPIILHVGGREHYKDFSTVLQAFGEEGLDLDFDLVAVGSQPHQLDGEAVWCVGGSGRGRVLLLGYVSDDILGALYRQASVCVTASLAEGFGLVPVEAMACGLPVAHAALAVFQETLDGHGHPFAPGEPSDCARAIRDAVRSGLAARAAAAQSVRERFDWRNTVIRTTGVYEGAVSASGR